LSASPVHYGKVRFPLQEGYIEPIFSSRPGCCKPGWTSPNYYYVVLFSHESPLWFILAAYDETGLLILVISASSSLGGKLFLCSFWYISGLSLWMMVIALAMLSLREFDAV